MTALTPRNRISIAEICFYAPTLFFAIFLLSRHGIGRSAAWVYLGVFSVVRVLGAALELATISQPLNIDIHVAGMIFQNIGISPLMLVVMGLVGQSLVAVRRTRKTTIHPIELRLVQLVIFLGLILVIVGGVSAGDTFKKTFQFFLPKTGKAGLSLIIAGFGLLVMAAIYVSVLLSHSASGPSGASTPSDDCHGTGSGASSDTETQAQAQTQPTTAALVAGARRPIMAVWLSFPFLVVRVVYGSMGTYTKKPTFNQLTGDPYVFLGMAVLMEMCVALICMVMGATLPPVPRAQQSAELRKIRQAVKHVLTGQFSKLSSSSAPATDERPDGALPSDLSVEKTQPTV